MKHEALEDEVEELLELDRLVEQEVRAFRMSGAESKVRKKSKRCVTNQFDNLNTSINNKQRLKSADKTAVVLKHSRKPDRYRMEAETDLDETSEAFDERLSHESFEFDAPEHNEFMFSEEDENFVNNTVEWLSQHEHKDLLMKAIWDRLTEFTPEMFYAPNTNVATAVEKNNEESSGGDNQ